jgi:arylsulfate sulfotransferase
MSRQLIATGVLALALLFVAALCVLAGTVSINGQTAGATPFIEDLTGMVAPAASLKSVQFTIAPKPGSVTRPISATYSASYLKSRGYLNIQTGALVVPVFGLYPNYPNDVALRFVFTDNTVQQSSAMVTAPAWGDTCGQFNNPTVIQARTGSTALSYDYFLIKNDCGSQSPVLMDSDGLVRWVGTAGSTSHASILFANGIYLSVRPPNSNLPTGLARMEFDGTMTFLQDYSGLGVTSTGHHNFDPGKYGILMEVDTTTQTESVIIEVDALGNPLRTWNLAAIISAAMTAGGDDPSQFVKSAPNDWFHNNAATYRASDDSLVVSSREEFVIALDYETGAIKWILGDPTKQWYQFPSLRRYALNLNGNTLPPIGQHAVSFTADDHLLLFDDGQNSASHTPAGTERDYSAPRKYQLDLAGASANEVWNYSNGPTLFSYICSSIYEDAANNFLIDYANITNLGSTSYAELVGIGPAGDKIFDYRYATTFCSTGWNSIPIHLESLSFATIDPVSAVSRKIHGAAGTFDINLPLTGNPGVECRSGGPTGAYQVVITFAAPVTVGAAAVDDGPGSHAVVAGSPIVNGAVVTINLTQVAASDSMVLTLYGVNDGTNLGTTSVPMNVILADCNGDGTVDNRDLKQTKGKASKHVTRSNFRADVTADGVINNADKTLIKANFGRIHGAR